jgi:hypothetical protein
MDTWRKLDGRECDAAWDGFYEMFRFKPSTRPEDWPGIAEPAESVTYDIGHAYDAGAAAYRRMTNDLGAKLIKALRRCVAPGSAIQVLDWQHPCYSFEPHGEFEFKSEADWPVPALPNGDYYIFIARDMEFGVFGHPWERTMCVFGQRLIDAFGTDKPELFTKVVRIGGRAA